MTAPIATPVYSATVLAVIAWAATSCDPGGVATRATGGDAGVASQPAVEPPSPSPAPGAPAAPTGDPEGRSLTDASLGGDTGKVREILAGGADVNWRDGHGSTALYATVNSDSPSLEVVRLLLEAGADPDIPCSHGHSPASVCAAESRIEFLRLLLSHGALAVGETGYQFDVAEAAVVDRRHAACLPYAAVHFTTPVERNGRGRARFSDEIDAVLADHFTANPPPSIAGQVTGID